jgi:type I restriction enzyme S subunit
MLSGKMYRFRVDDRFVDPKYIEAYLLTDGAGRAIDALKTGISNSGLNLTQRRFAGLMTPLAPLPEQRRIVAAIDEHVPRIGAAIKAFDTAAQRVRALRLSVLRDELNPNAPRRPITDLLLKNIGGVWGKAPGLAEVDVTVIRVTEFRAGGNLDPSTAVTRGITRAQRESRELKYGDILLEKSGGSTDRPVGRAAWVGHVDGPAVCANFVQLLRADPGLADARYVFHWLTRLYADGAVDQFQRATTNIRNLKTQNFLATEIPVPPLDEQHLIVGRIDAALSASDRLSIAIEAARARGVSVRAAILARAFSGELVPQNPSDEPASVLLERISAERVAAPKPTRKRKETTPA